MGKEQKTSSTIFTNMQNVVGSKITAKQAAAAVSVLCEQMEYDPLKEMIALAQLKMEKADGTEVYALDPGARFAIAKEIMPYVAPKIKTADLQEEADKGVTVSVNLGDLFSGQSNLPHSVTAPSDDATKTAVESSPASLDSAAVPISLPSMEEMVSEAQGNGDLVEPPPAPPPPRKDTTDKEVKDLLVISRKNGRVRGRKPRMDDLELEEQNKRLEIDIRKAMYGPKKQK